MKPIHTALAFLLLSLLGAVAMIAYLVTNPRVQIEYVGEPHSHPEPAGVTEPTLETQPRQWSGFDIPADAIIHEDGGWSSPLDGGCLPFALCDDSVEQLEAVEVEYTSKTSFPDWLIEGDRYGNSLLCRPWTSGRTVCIRLNLEVE